MSEQKELHFTFIKFDEEQQASSAAEGRMVCHEGGQVTEIYEGTIRNCLNEQLEMLYKHGIAAEKFRIRKGDGR